VIGEELADKTAAGIAERWDSQGVSPATVSHCGLSPAPDAEIPLPADGPQPDVVLSPDHPSPQPDSCRNLRRRGPVKGLPVGIAKRPLTGSRRCVPSGSGLGRPLHLPAI
jgi:hypothetical protein